VSRGPYRARTTLDLAAPGGEVVAFPWKNGTIWIGGRRHPARRRRLGERMVYQVELDGYYAAVTDAAMIVTWIGEV